MNKHRGSAFHDWVLQSMRDPESAAQSLEVAVEAIRYEDDDYIHWADNSIDSADVSFLEYTVNNVITTWTL